MPETFYYMDKAQILSTLYSLEPRQFRRTIFNMRLLLGQLGNPERKLKIIHVTGTNGKGSVCAMMQSALMEAGYKAGLYTSPHLKRFNERIRVNNELISDKEIIEYYEKIKKYSDRNKNTFFEITTAMAYLYFSDKNADFAVIEVGLGGRLDTTNTIKPLLSVITNVSVDHTEFLGNRIESIARDKAGIVKYRVPCVTGADGLALQAIKKISSKKNSKLFIIKKDKKIRLDYLYGEFQQGNAAIAMKSMEVLNDFYNLNIDKKDIENGIKKTKWPGRMQFLEKNVLLDCAHNYAGVEVLARELKKLKSLKKYKEIVMVCGFSKEKEIRKMVGKLDSVADYYIFTKSDNKRAAEPSEIRKYTKKDSVIIQSPKKALKEAKKLAGEKGLVAVSGSIFLVGKFIGNGRG